MCDICNTNVTRNFKHIKTSEHMKKLFAVMRAKKKASIIVNGYFKYDGNGNK